MSTDNSDSDEIVNRAIELCYEAEELPYGAPQLAMFEEAVRLADSINHEDLAFAIRGSLCRSAIFSGRPELMLVHFSWCLAKSDADPERFDGSDLLWQYKWVIENGPKIAQISRAKLEALLVDMDRRFQEVGSSTHAVANRRRQLYAHLGEHEIARQAHLELSKLDRDELSDCAACVSDSTCEYHVFQHEWEEAVLAAEPVLTGNLSCEEQPHLILARVLVPLLRQDKVQEAKTYQKQGYRLVSDSPQFVTQHGQHIQFLSLVGEVDQAQNLLQRHLPGALATIQHDELFRFMLAGHTWAQRAAAKGKTSIHLQTHASLPPTGADGKHDVRTLGEWFAAEAQRLAGKFDARNGKPAFQEQINDANELLAMATA